MSTINVKNWGQVTIEDTTFCADVSFLFSCDLQEFFISGGDGLPRGTVENLVARVRPVIKLISFEVRHLHPFYSTQFSRPK